MGKGGLSIGDVAQATGVKIVTIRYYEQINVMPAPPRSDGNYRIYSQEHVLRLQFIRRCRELGFTLDQVRDLLRLSAEKQRPCAEVDRITKQHLASIEEKLADLSSLARQLRRLSTCCAGDRAVADCPIIESLVRDGKSEQRRGSKPVGRRALVL